MKNIFEDALIGYNGYIGSFLDHKLKFKYKYNSKNITNIGKKKFRKVYIAAPHSLKYWANQNPLEDTKIINNFINNLKNLKAKKIIYFSSTDIYSKRKKVNENTKFLKNKSNVYGHNRFRIEKYIKENFKNYNIIRLPALFGWKLKKNFFFDLQKSRSLKYYNKDSKFQWYCIDWLIDDLKNIEKNNIKLINLVSEPIGLFEISSHLRCNKKFSISQSKVDYNIFTKYSWNKNSQKYVYLKTEILKKMKNIF